MWQGPRTCRLVSGQQPDALPWPSGQEQSSLCRGSSSQRRLWLVHAAVPAWSSGPTAEGSDSRGRSGTTANEQVGLNTACGRPRWSVLCGPRGSQGHGPPSRCGPFSPPALLSDPRGRHTHHPRHSGTASRARWPSRRRPKPTAEPTVLSAWVSLFRARVPGTEKGFPRPNPLVSDDRC